MLSKIFPKTHFRKSILVVHLRTKQFSSIEAIKSSKLMNQLLIKYKHLVKINSLTTGSYMESVVLKEFAKFVAGRNIEMGFVPNRLELESFKDYHKIIGDCTLSQETGMWAKIDKSTSFQNIHVEDHELLVILNKLSDKLGISKSDFLRLCQELMKLRALNSIGDLIHLLTSLRD